MEFFINHSMYVALVVAATVLLGILFYLMRLDSRLRKLEASRVRVDVPSRRRMND